MEKNQSVIVTAEGFGTSGEGVASAGETTLFIPYLLPGERARVKVLKVKGGAGYGKIEEIITPAEERVRPRCPVFYRCGGCQLQHIRYRDQLKLKTRILKDTLKKIGGVETKISPCERSEKEYGYRNKLQLAVGRQNGENAVGFYAERSHRIVSTTECPIHPAWSEKLIAALVGFMEKCGLDGYDETSKTGQIRHIVVREVRKKFIIVLVTTMSEIKGIDYFAYLLGEIFPEFSLYLNLNTGDSNAVLGDEFRLIRGKGSYEGSDSGIVFEVGPNTFMQVNDSVRGKLYDRIVASVEGGVAVDCYSGGGLLTAMLAKKCERVYGIEVVPEASAMAEKLAARNGIGNMKAVCGKVEEKLARILEREEVASVVLDPPRSGVERSVLKLLKERRVGRIVMVSCNPATLARDLGFLTGTLAETESGELVKTQDPHTMYEIELIQPFDMFPQTRHIETLVVLTRKGEEEDGIVKAE